MTDDDQQFTHDSPDATQTDGAPGVRTGVLPVEAVPDTTSINGTSEPLADVSPELQGVDRMVGSYGTPPPRSYEGQHLTTSTTGQFVPGSGELRPDNAQPKKRHSMLRALVEFALALVIALALTWVVKTFFVEPFEVPSGSMETTIMTGDKLLADKYTINFDAVKKGDIIVFADKVQPGRILVKRVIAVGGQTVDLINGRVYVDDNPLLEPYINDSQTLPLAQHFDNMPIDYPFTVPEGHLWVMGDNREHSADSRYFGSIPADTVYGRAFMVFWPIEHIGPL
ncbi:MAG: signal peptidase I [Coriobacteriales bacterium]|jgi:signal peptidase I|nr:signal peptidase I [Coriobacteriales bacterium]